MEIPKIIHQTWKTKEIPEEWKEFQRTWKEFNPDWQYILWTDDDCLQFVKKNFPEFLNTYSSYSYNIQRADAFRYFLLYQYGGLYVDLDFECLRPVDGLLTNEGFVIGKEPQIHGKWLDTESIISNAFMASTTGHPFVAEIIATLKRTNPRIVSHREVLDTTGPLMITNVLSNYRGKDVCILPDHVLFPFARNSREMRKLAEKKDDYPAVKKRFIENGTYAIHYWSNTWVRNLAGQLINPDPFAVEGYRFYPGLDSPGCDIVNKGRDVSILAIECAKEEKAVAFNTDGFLKHDIQPMHKWVEMGDRDGNEGLYVKEKHLSRLRQRPSLFRTALASLRRKIIFFEKFQ